jgi:hypothetical protein
MLDVIVVVVVVVVVVVGWMLELRKAAWFYTQIIAV